MPVCTAPRLRCSMPCIENARPRMLLASQCRLRWYQKQKPAAAAPLTASG